MSKRTNAPQGFQRRATREPAATGPADTVALNWVHPAIGRARRFAQSSSLATAPMEEEVVASKLSQSGRLRREFAHALARRHGVEVSDDVERFFAAVESGNWDDIEAALKKISGGERRVIVTQNGLADGTCLDYLRIQYDDRLTTLTDEDSKRAFPEYVADAQKRSGHDQQFPAEPKQIRPGEDVRVIDGKVQVGRQAAVMAINALPLGPRMELRTQDGQNTFTAILARELTREAIFDALRHRHNYATTQARIVLDFRINGHIMGEEIEIEGDPQIVVDVRGTDQIREVVLVRDGKALRSARPKTQDLSLEHVDRSYVVASYDYVRVVQTDKDQHGNHSQAWTARLLTTACQATDNSGLVTRAVARAVAEAVRAVHHELEVGRIARSHVEAVEKRTGAKLNWKDPDPAPQNIQAPCARPASGSSPTCRTLCSSNQLQIGGIDLYRRSLRNKIEAQDHQHLAGALFHQAFQPAQRSRLDLDLAPLRDVRRQADFEFGLQRRRMSPNCRTNSLVHDIQQVGDVIALIHFPSLVRQQLQKEVFGNSGL